MYEVKKFLLFFTPALIWGFTHYSGADLVSFLINTAAAISGYFAALKWIASAQAGTALAERSLTDDEMRDQVRTQASYNAAAAIYAALSAALVATNQLVPVALWYMTLLRSH